jgi:hypothetical protein
MLASTRSFVYTFNVMGMTNRRSAKFVGKGLRPRAEKGAVVDNAKATRLASIPMTPSCAPILALSQPRRYTNVTLPIRPYMMHPIGAPVHPKVSRRFSNFSKLEASVKFHDHASTL